MPTSGVCQDVFRVEILPDPEGRSVINSGLPSGHVSQRNNKGDDADGGRRESMEMKQEAMH